MADIPVAVAYYGLEVPCGDMMISGNLDDAAPGRYRITMAAIDPTQEPQEEGPRRATLKIIRIQAYDDMDDQSDDEDDEDFDSDDVEAIERRLNMVDSDEEDSEDGQNGGPGEKTKNARQAALRKAIEKAEKADALDLTNGHSGKSSKGKQKASVDEDEDDEDLDDFDDDDEEGDDIEEHVICTLDPDRQYQQPLDITIDAREQVFFKVTGAYNIFLTGNYMAKSHEWEDYDEEQDDEATLASMGLEGIDAMDDEEDFSEEDELDDMRIMEVDSEDEAPKLIKAAKSQKNGKKRSADESDDEDVNEEILKKILKAEEPAVNGEAKLSKKQKKKLKNNAGQATDAPVADAKAGAEKVKAEAKETPTKDNKDSVNGSGKKVQFAEKLVQDQPKKADAKADTKPENKKNWTVNGVQVDERKTGTGAKAKPGSKLGMRYIGKLKDGKVFDSNTKGEPFKFTLGKGQVIKGWDVGINGMMVGGERRIVIPAAFAYGKQKQPGIPANSELTFDIKLVSLN